MIHVVRPVDLLILSFYASRGLANPEHDAANGLLMLRSPMKNFPDLGNPKKAFPNRMKWNTKTSGRTQYQLLTQTRFFGNRWLGILGLGSLAWNLWIGISGLGSWAQDLWFGIFGMGSWA